MPMVMQMLWNRSVEAKLLGSLKKVSRALMGLVFALKPTRRSKGQIKFCSKPPTTKRIKVKALTISKRCFHSVSVFV